MVVWVVEVRAGSGRGKVHDPSLYVIEALEPRVLLSSTATTAALVSPEPLGYGQTGTAGPVGLVPAIIRHAYGIDQISLNGGVIGDGTGQTIAIVEAYDNPGILSSTDPNFANSDLHRFDQQFGLVDPPSFSKLMPFGTPVANKDWGLESDLSIQWTHTMAPQAHIVLVEALSNGSDDIINALDYARNLAGVGVVSMIWRMKDSLTTNFENHLMTPGGHQGVTFVGATGDASVEVGYPGSSPRVLGVGGTTLSLNGNNYAAERAWNFSGGGPAVWNRPIYQRNTGLMTAYRTAPDVSFDADSVDGVPVYDAQFASSDKPWVAIKGTGLGCSSWAGLIAIVNQDRALMGYGSLDGPMQTLPSLYQLPDNDFHDVTTGDNFLFFSGVGYFAGPGYDSVTGRGTPIANLLVPDLANESTHLQVAEVSPGPGANLFEATPPSDFSVTFSRPVAPASVHLSGFTVNGILADSLSLDSSNTVVTLHYNVPAITVQGPQVLSVAAGAAIDAADGSTTTTTVSEIFHWVVQQLQIVSTIPGEGSTVPYPLNSIDVNFNEPIDPIAVHRNSLSLNPGDLALGPSAGTVRSATVLNGNTTVRFTLSGLAVNDVTAEFAAGAFTDAYGVPSAAHALNFRLASLGIISTSPRDQTLLASSDPPAEFTVRFDSTVDPATVRASGFTVNGIAADSFSLHVADTEVNFHYNTSPVVVAGPQTISFASDSAERVSDRAGNLDFKNSFGWAHPTEGLAETSVPRPYLGRYHSKSISVGNLAFFLNNEGQGDIYNSVTGKWSTTQFTSVGSAITGLTAVDGWLFVVATYIWTS